MTAPISNPGRGAFGGQPGFSFNAIDRTMIASYGDYAGAQRAIDYLSDKGFPVEHTAIVGSDLRLVEQVTGFDGRDIRPRRERKRNSWWY